MGLLTHRLASAALMIGMTCWASHCLAEELARIPASVEGSEQFVVRSDNCDPHEVDCTLQLEYFSNRTLVSKIRLSGWRNGPLRLGRSPAYQHPYGGIPRILEDTGTRFWHDKSGEEQVGLRALRISTDRFGILVTDIGRRGLGAGIIAAHHSLYGIRNGQVARLWEGDAFDPRELYYEMVGIYDPLPNSPVEGFYEYSLNGPDSEDSVPEWKLEAYQWNADQQRLERQDSAIPLYAAILGSYRNVREAQQRWKDSKCPYSSFGLLDTRQLPKLKSGLIVYASLHGRKEDAEKALQGCKSKYGRDGYVKQAR